MAEVKRTLALLDERCAALMRQERVEAGAPRIRHFADVCYIGQAYTLEVELQADRPDAMDRLTRDFLAAHDRVYGYAPGVPIKIVNVRAVHAVEGLADLDETGWRPRGSTPVKRTTPILVGAGEPVTATVYDRSAMPVGFAFAGPAIVEQADTTTLVTPGWRGRVDDSGNIILER